MPAQKSSNPLSPTMLIIGQNWFRTVDHADTGTTSSGKLSWSGPQLEDLLVDHLSQLTNKAVTIVLADNLALNIPFTVPIDQDNSPDALTQIVHTKLTRDPDTVGIDIQTVLQQDNQTLYTAFVVNKNLLEIIGRVAKTAQLSIESVKPLSEIIAQKYPQPKSTCTIFTDQLTTILVNKAGKVLAAVVTKPDQVYKQIPTLLSFCQQQLKVKVKHLLFDPSNTTLAKEKLSNDLVFSEEELNPFESTSGSKELFGTKSQPESTATELALETDLTDQDQLPESEPIEASEPTSTKTIEFDSDSETQPDQAPDSAGDLDISDKAPKLPLRVAKVQTPVSESMDQPSTTQQSKPKVKVIITLTVIVALLTGIVIGGLIIYNNATKSLDPELLPTPLPQVESTPEAVPQQPGSTESAVPTSTLDVSTLSVRILNGSGVAGAAGAVQTLLEDADFSEITTGNAANYDFETTEIQVKSGQSELLELVESTLSDDYTIGSATDDLDPDSDYDVVITVGKE